MMVKRIHTPLAGGLWITLGIGITAMDSAATTVLESGTGTFIEAETSGDLCGSRDSWATPLLRRSRAGR